MRRKKSPVVYWTEADVEELRVTLDALVRSARQSSEVLVALNDRIKELESSAYYSSTVGYR